MACKCRLFSSQQRTIELLVLHWKTTIEPSSRSVFDAPTSQISQVEKQMPSEDQEVSKEDVTKGQ